MSKDARNEEAVKMVCCSPLSSRRDSHIYAAQVKAAFSECPSYARLIEALRTRPLWAIMGDATDAKAERERGAGGAAEGDAEMATEADAPRTAWAPPCRITAGVPVGPMLAKPTKNFDEVPRLTCCVFFRDAVFSNVSRGHSRRSSSV